MTKCMMYKIDNNRAGKATSGNFFGKVYSKAKFAGSHLSHMFRTKYDGNAKAIRPQKIYFWTNRSLQLKKDTPVLLTNRE